MPDTGDGYLVYYEQLGNPGGKPVLNVHGGPGAGTPQRPTRAWDPEEWELAKAWPDAQLHIIEDSGHAGSEALRQTMLAAVEQFKHRSG